MPILSTGYKRGPKLITAKSYKQIIYPPAYTMLTLILLNFYCINEDLKCTLGEFNYKIRVSDHGVSEYLSQIFFIFFLHRQRREAHEHIYSFQVRYEGHLTLLLYLVKRYVPSFWKMFCKTVTIATQLKGFQSAMS